ncbi:MAG: 50S ribosomal protein L25 [Chloroflexi bacterium]|nr:50S ribosomal protein L25 [Chloroflexota bacterium]
MSNQLELVVEERVISGKQVRRLRQQGIVPANMYGHNQSSVPLQVNNKALQGVLARGGNNVILSLKVGNQPTVQALIKKVQHNPVSGETTHVDFYRVAATETLKTHVQLHFVNEAIAANLGGVTVLRSLNEVMVECLPGDLPSAIEVDLSPLREVGAVIRVGNLTVGPGVTILTDHSDMVAGMHRQAAAGKEEAVEGKTEAVAVAP